MVEKLKRKMASLSRKIVSWRVFGETAHATRNVRRRGDLKRNGSVRIDKDRQNLYNIVIFFTFRKEALYNDKQNAGLFRKR